jgi:cytochrome c
MLATPKSQRRAALLLAILLVVGINLLGDILSSLFRPRVPAPLAVVKQEQVAQPSISRGESPAQAPLPVTASPAPEPAKDPAKPEPAKPEPTKPEPAKAEPAKPEPVKAEPAKPEPAKAEAKPAPLPAVAPPATVAERPQPKQAPSAGPGAPQIALSALPGATPGVSAVDALAQRLNAADSTRGAKLSVRCSACHGFDPGGRHRVGPNLYEVVGSQKGAKVGFSYSPAISGLGGVWGYQELDAYLASPQNFAPGNKMAFPGLPDPGERADLIVFLRKLSANPKPLP